MNESPAKAIRPLELHSPNAYNIDRHDDIAMKSPQAKKGTPSSSSAPRMMPTMNDDDNDGENRGRPCDSFRLSPIGRVDFSTPAVNMEVSETPIASRLDTTIFGGDTTRDEGAQMNGSEENLMDSSFPDNRGDVEIHSPDAAVPGDDVEEVEAEETEEERMQREIEESEALARQLMGKT